VLPKDERKGGSEEMRFDYSKVPANIASIDHYVTIFEGRERGQSFVMMADAKVVLTNTDTGAEIQTFSLANFTNDTALHIGASIRNAQGGWEFQPAGTARAMNLPEIVGLYVQ
jgi:stress response protein SCP2